MAVVAAALALPMVSHSADTESTRLDEQYVNDSVITTKVKAELAAGEGVEPCEIQVDTDNAGVVTLSGTAANQMAKDKAVSIAQAVKGVTSVDNQIKVVADK